MHNTLATLTLLIWPIVTAVMYLKLPPARALIWSVLSAYLILPAATEIDLPLIPGLSKYMIPAFFGYIMACVTQGRMISLIPQARLAQLLLAMVVIGVFGTVATNAEPIFITRNVVLPGLRPYDALSMLIVNLGWLLIWAMAREFITDRSALRDLCRALVVAFLWYSILALYEVRMSPQLHRMVYGFFQHDFGQMMRQGGFRPIVFLEHGLWLSILLAMATLAAVVMARSGDDQDRKRWYLCAAYLAAVLVLSKSIGALLLSLTVAPFILFAGARMMQRVAFVLATVILLFPLMRANGLVPVDAMLEFASSYSAERAQSLGFRFHHENIFLENIAQKPLFGWGGYGRFMAFDPETGEGLSVADGAWVISLGGTGYVGFLGQFGLLTAPILLLGHAFRRAGQPVTPLAAGMALVLVVNLLDLLPNATLTPVTWMFAGGLLGYLERLKQTEDAPDRPSAALPGHRSFAGLVGAPIMAGPRSLI